MSEERDAALNRYWNALVSGDGVDACGLDADDAETVFLLHHAAASRTAGRPADEAWPVVLARMRDGERAPAQRAEWQPLPLAPPHVPNGCAHDAAAPASRPHPNRWRGAWGIRPGMLATAAL